MSKVELLEQEVQQLSAEELARFREWFTEFEWQTWDRRIADDVKGGKLDDLAQNALDDHAEGRTKPL